MANADVIAESAADFTMSGANLFARPCLPVFACADHKLNTQPPTFLPTSTTQTHHNPAALCKINNLAVKWGPSGAKATGRMGLILAGRYGRLGPGLLKASRRWARVLRSLRYFWSGFCEGFADYGSEGAWFRKAIGGVAAW